MMSKENISIFPTGEKNKVFDQFFSGQSYLNTLSSGQLNIYNVTFEPGCRNNWHIHHKSGQTLLVTSGRGYYQEWGGYPIELHPGDVINVPAEVKHWHGAASDSWFAHLEVEAHTHGAHTEWLEEVHDDNYSRLK